MPRRYPDKQRHRPGRRPPHHYSGFTPPGVDAFYKVALPGLAGREKRAYFNALAGRLVVVLGLAGAVLGLCWLGPLGALPGLAAGVLVGARFAAKGRFYRG